MAKDPRKDWADQVAALRRRRDPLDHQLADQMEQCSDNPNNGGTGQGPARYPTVERQARQAQA
jgi:hypothetical protein